MPVNEILAPYYLKVKYNTGVARHTMHMYFETGTSLNAGGVLTPNNRKIQGSGSLVDVDIATIVYETFHRVQDGLTAATVVEEIQIWQSAAGANIFVQNNDVSDGDIGGSGVGIASAYRMVVAASADRSKARFTFFEWLTASPQRQVGLPPPTSDDNSLAWYLLRSLVPFATNDGKRLTSITSYNDGYNRRLARRYGRQISP